MQLKDAVFTLLGFWSNMLSLHPQLLPFGVRMFLLYCCIFICNTGFAYRESHLRITLSLRRDFGPWPWEQCWNSQRLWGQLKFDYCVSHQRFSSWNSPEPGRGAGSGICPFEWKVSSILHLHLHSWWSPFGEIMELWGHRGLLKEVCP